MTPGSRRATRHDDEQPETGDEQLGLRTGTDKTTTTNSKQRSDKGNENEHAQAALEGAACVQCEQRCSPAELSLRRVARLAFLRAWVPLLPRQGGALGLGVRIWK
ncbi:hypothetical protein DPX16_15614 [Anabarilius grahami]|uniref:Uncharacterized protein n=1 Tax=Anabarilius grahami TaxID=495550 RepID=A0A3N0YE20_ANAGA|nr:hypothetical protein DPX16_15614 [Anabarilius grahami]